jgi:anti-anti-sigma factor
MKLQVDSDSDGVVKVNVAGVLSLSGSVTVEPLGELLGELPYAKQVLLNVRDAERIDSSGIGWLVTCQDRFKQGGGKLVIHSVQPMVATVLRTVRLDRMFHVAPNERHGLVLLRGETS